MKYKEYTLSNNVVEYIKDCLSWDKTLSKAILREKDINEGKMLTLLPKDFDINKISNYRYGGVASRKNTTKWILGKIEQFIKENNDNIVLLQHALARPTDPFLRESKLPIIKHHNDVFVYMSAKNVKGIDDINKCLLFADNHFLVGIMSSIKIDCSTAINKFDSEILIELVVNSRYMFISAFDVEGYILCKF